MTDFSRLRLRRNRKQYLVAPAGFTADTPHRLAPVFERPVHQLAGDFRRHALEQPRVAMVDIGIDGRQLEVIHRSSLFKISTRISAEFMPVDDRHSTLAVYSRTRYGSRAANRRRVDEWLHAIGAPDEKTEGLAPQPAESPASA